MTKFSILQLNKNCDSYHSKKFSTFNDLKNRLNTIPNLNDYNVIYTSELSDDFNKSDMQLCEDVFNIFNLNHPDDFVGHSLSVSDIVAINGNYFYCDDFGFVKLETYINYRKIDWETRRYEIAKHVISAINAQTPELMAEKAVKIADALINELKK